MDRLLNATTRFGWRCRKAVLLLIALLLAVLCALFTPAGGQSIQAMVQKQPFPYAQGVAIDTLLYQSIRAKLGAADALRTQSQRTIASLQAELTGVQAALEARKKLSAYDGRKLDSLSLVAYRLNTQLALSTDQLSQAQRALTDVLAKLPRRARKTLQQGTPDQIATAVVDYIHRQQRRKWIWATASTVMGSVLTASALIF